MREPCGVLAPSPCQSGWLSHRGEYGKSNLSFTHSTYASLYKEICHLPTLPPAIAHCVDDAGHRSKDCVIHPAPPVPGT